MLKKRIVAYLLVALLLVGMPGTVVLAAEAETAEETSPPADVLVVSASEIEGAALLELVSACGRNADLVLETGYDAELLAEYDYLIADCAAPWQDCLAMGLPLLLVGDGVSTGGEVTLEWVRNTGVVVTGEGYSGNSRFEDEVAVISEYTGSVYGTLTVRDRSYPFSVRGESATYVPYYRAGELSAILLGAVMQVFFGGTAKGKMYVVIDEVYAFTDLYALCLAADLLYENAIPYIVRIMPIYDNLDYPAFQRYAQVLRYMQARGGTVVPAPPLVSESEHVREPLEDKMTRFHAALKEEGVAFVEMGHTPYLIDADTLGAIRPDSKNFGHLPIDTMVNLPLHGEKEAMRAEIDKLNDLWLSIDNYRRSFSNANYQFHEIPIDDTYAYVEEEEKLLAAQFAVGNEVLVVLVAVFLVVLVALVVVGARVYQRKFRK